jgi:2-polyprenyl-6-hydroxyphenyl methylase/3-demethylubiquinone-9 3-methyltransferase
MMAHAKKTSTLNPEEISRFSALAGSWWDPEGPMRPLHRLNPVRLAYLEAQITEHFLRAPEKIRLLDIGCGAGLVSEGMAAKGFAVSGIDASQELIAAARTHAAETETPVDYRAAAAETLVEAGESYDAVLALEVVEHVANPALFIHQCANLLKKGGIAIFSTLNRTPKSFALGIVGAEYILHWLPIGTHDWRAFIKPSELAVMAEGGGLRVADICGMRYDPFRDSFSMSPRDVAVNYFMSAVKD